MRIGLALPQYDYSLSSGKIGWEPVRNWALRAEELGFDSVWLSDHLFLDVSKYGGPDHPQAAMECFTTLAAIAAVTKKVRLGALVVCNDLRHPALVAKMAAALDVLSKGRLEIGLGAGWYEPEFKAAGIEFPRAGVRIARLEEAVQIVVGMLSEEAFSFEGKYYRIDQAVNLPRPEQRPRPPVWIGGKGDRVTSAAGKWADGFNSVWAWTPEDFKGRIEVLDAASRMSGRDPAKLRKSVGLYCLPGTSESDIRYRWSAYMAASPPGVEPPGGLEAWRTDKLVGNPGQIIERIAEFGTLGVEEVILGFGVLPYQLADSRAIELIAKEVLPAVR